MSDIILRKTLLILFVYSSSHQFCFANKNSEYLVDSEIFKLPGNGEISMNIPRAWNYSFSFSDDSQPPLITFYIPGNESIFQLNMSILWDDGYSRNITSPIYIRSLVEKTGNDILGFSDEEKLIVNEISGSNGTGYLFDLTDSNAEEGEYKHLTQGAISLGKVLLIFSLFSNDKESLFRSATLSAIKSAKHYYRKDV